jgi:hypothetical protein
MNKDILLARLLDAVREFDQAVKRENSGRPVERTAHGSNLGRYEKITPAMIWLPGDTIADLQFAWDLYQSMEP